MSCEHAPLILVECLQEGCGQTAEIFDAMEIPANQTSTGLAVMVVSVQCINRHFFRGELDGRFKPAVTR